MRLKLNSWRWVFCSTSPPKPLTKPLPHRNKAVMNLFNRYHAHIIDIIHSLIERGDLPRGLSTAPVTVEPPRDPSHGDLATNVAMVLAKPAGKPPRVIAELVATELRTIAGVAEVSIAGPGFINLRLDASTWQQQLAIILDAGADYGRSTMGANSHINVEYVSANPTGPMHMGHCRGAVVGDVLANILALAGHKVTREYYVNDAGGQVDVLARSVHLRYREALGETTGDIPEGLYPGEYLIPVGQSMAKQYGDIYADAPEKNWLSQFKRAAVDAMLVLIKADLSLLGIHHDLFSSEQAVQDADKVNQMLAELDKRGLVYIGVLEAPRGKTNEDWEQKPLLLFRASQFGDDSDRPLKKASGDWTYFAGDIAYHYDKASRSDAMINIWGADHVGTVKRIKAAVAALSDGHMPFDIPLVQMVHLLRNGEPVKMSKRSGNFVTLAEVVEEVGSGVVRFIMLTRKADSQLDFDFAKVLEQSRDNPVFYVQYAHARICSALRKAQDIDPNVTVTIKTPTSETLALLNRPEEIALMRQIAEWPRVVETAALAREPHRIAFFLSSVAGALHGHWNLGNDDPTLRFLMADNQPLTAARAVLLAAVKQVIGNGLALMGIKPLEEM